MLGCPCGGWTVACPDEQGELVINSNGRFEMGRVIFLMSLSVTAVLATSEAAAQARVQYGRITQRRRRQP